MSERTLDVIGGVAVQQRGLQRARPGDGQPRADVVDARGQRHVAGLREQQVEGPRDQARRGDDAQRRGGVRAAEVDDKGAHHGSRAGEDGLDAHAARADIGWEQLRRPAVEHREGEAQGPVGRVEHCQGQPLRSAPRTEHQQHSSREGAADHRALTTAPAGVHEHGRADIERHGHERAQDVGGVDAEGLVRGEEREAVEGEAEAEPIETHDADPEAQPAIAQVPERAAGRGVRDRRGRRHRPELPVLVAVVRRRRGLRAPVGARHRAQDLVRLLHATDGC
mmetsp:Transcript_91762/g.264028  ORF Transcript_91762/g.264028 Transcript_91762/m.264028 type:complete len:280 (+) Transcript_91762:216-1055(+)